MESQTKKSGRLMGSEEVADRYVNRVANIRMNYDILTLGFARRVAEYKGSICCFLIWKS